MVIATKSIVFCCIFLFLYYLMLSLGNVTLIVVSAGIFACMGLTLGTRQHIRDKRNSRVGTSNRALLLLFTVTGMVVGGFIALLIIIFLESI